MYKKINDLLQKTLGVRIIRLPRKKHIRSKNDNTKPLYIEIIGASGVGKTFLFNKLKKRTRHWVTWDEFLLDKKNLINDTTLDDHVFYQTITKYHLEIFNDLNYRPVEKLRSLSWHSMRLVDDYLIKTYNKNQIVINDEGFLLSFYRSFNLLINKEPNFLKNCKELENRAFIFCHADSDVIAKNVIKRTEEGGHIIPMDKVDFLEELIAVQEKKIRDFKKLKNHLDALGLPILEINTSDEIDDNIKKINDFITGFQNS